jgi:hypothetical protein
MTQREQDLRIRAAQAQMRALKAQLLAINIMDSEHSYGVENTFEAEQLYRRCRSVAAKTMVLNRSIGKCHGSRLAEELLSFEKLCTELKSDTLAFTNAARDRAEQRLPRLSERIPLTHGDLVQKANLSCYSAERCQYATFLEQIEAICDLCAEIIYNAAAH